MSVRDVIFKGAAADYMVILDNGIELSVSDASNDIGIVANDPVHLVWPVNCRKTAL